MRISRKAKRELVFILFFCVSGALMYALVWGKGGYLHLRQTREELRQLQYQNLRYREQHLQQLERIEKLKNDPAEIERIAREKYNFARPGDIIVNVPEGR